MKRPDGGQSKQSTIAITPTLTQHTLYKYKWMECMNEYANKTTEYTNTYTIATMPNKLVPEKSHAQASRRNLPSNHSYQHWQLADGRAHRA